MNPNKIFILLVILGVQFLSAQVKIGQNPNTINSASLVELESTDKAFVLTRVSTAQMQAITPLRGAVVFNTDTQCVHFFDSLQWVNLCSDANNTGFSFTDNNDGTITLSDGNGSDLTFNGAPETISSLVDNLDGTYTYTNESGVETTIVNTPTVPQNLNTDGTSGNIGIDAGNAIVLNVDDADSDAGNEIQDLQFSSGIISLTDDPDATLIDLSSYDNTAAITANADAINAEVTRATDAENVNASDIADNVLNITDLQNNKEDTANKSTDVALGTSDDAFPTQNAVKTYVDNQIGTITTDDDITGVSFDGTSNQVTVEEGTTSFSADLSALEESADIAAVQTDVDNNEADADAAIALKEDTANKSADVALGTSDDAFPTQNAVKTYVDNQVGTITTDDDITGVSFDGTSNQVTVEEGTTSFSADLSALEESADIAAVQTDVDNNETATNTAIAAVQTDVDNNEADADAAIALKENTANKSADIALGTSDDAFPTQNAVKTYVDNQVGTITTDDDITGVSFDGTSNQVTVEEGTTSFSADLSALEESADIAAVQTDVDNNEADADTAIALKEDTANKSADVALGTSDDAFPTQNAVKTYVDNQIGTITTDDDITGVSFDGTSNQVTVEEGTTSFSADLSALEESADIAAVQTDVDNNEADADTAIAAVQTDVDNNEADADAAIALKEDTANKSADVALGTSDDAFPTQNAVKTYVDNQVGTITTDDDITGVSFDGTSNQVTVEEGTTSFSADLSALEESADIAAVQTDVDNNEADADTAIAAVQTDVDNNETAADTAIAAVQTDVDNNEADADAAIALKEDTANKSADVALGTSDDAFPTQNAVKTYVDNQVGTITTDDDITGVSFDGTSNQVTVEEGTTSFSADLSALEESADIAAVQTDVDNNEIATNTAIAALQTDVDNNETAADTAIAAVQTDVDNNEADADTAIALKEDTANKSADVALGTSDDAFPTQNAVKTYVDNQIGTITTDDDITGVSFDGTSNQVTVEEGTTSFSADLSALEESADIAAVQTDVDNNEADADTAIAAVQTDVDNNEADADAAIALKEDTANKSADVALGTSDDAFPTQNAVKTYVDNQVGTITTDDDITGVSFDGTSNQVTVEEGTTSFSADLSALEESADIAAVQTDVDNNEADADTAIAAVQTDVDNNETAADTAIAAVQTDVDNNEADADAAIALKEDTANKSADVALGTSDDAFPTQNAVKTYVDNQVGTITTDDDITGVSFDDTSNQVTVEEGTTSFSADLSALEESADIAAVQTDVDNNEIATNTAIAALQTDVDNNETAADTAIAAVQTDVDNNEADADTAIAAVQTDVDNNEADADAAIALKEDTANKSADVALGTSDDAFPTQNAVKTYVDNQIGTITTDDDITGVSFDGTSNQVTVEEGTTSFSADLSALEESDDIAAVQTDVDNNETAADTAIAAVQTDVDNNEADADTAIALKEDTANKSADIALGTSDDAFPTQNAVKTYVDNQIGTITTDDDITGVSFDGTSNQVTVEEGTTSFSADLSALEESADVAAVQTDVDNNEADADTAIAAVQTDVDNNEADADAAIALKEDTANKSADVALGTSDDAFPTQNAVKTYVDNQIGTITTDDDITGVSFDGTSNQVTVEEGTTSFSADLSALEESADIAAVQTDVDNNEIATNTAIAALQTDVDNNETAADTAIAAVQTDVDNNEADADAAIALKEDTANKSADVALGTSDDAFPTQNAVKTYVDNQIGTITTDDDITGVSFDGTSNQVTVEEGTTSFSADLSALEESADIAAVQTDVDNNEADADTAIALKEDTANKSADIALGTSDDAFPTQNAVKTYVDNQIGTITTDDDITGVSFDGTSNQVTVEEGTTSFSADLSALEESADIAAVQTDVDNNEADADAAIALKEDTANKSVDVALGTSDDAFPTQNAVKTYVDNQIGTITTDDDITGVSFDGTSNQVTVEEGTTSFSADLSALEESADIAAVQTDVDNNEIATNTAIAALQTDVDNNETAADTAIAAVQTDVDNNEADADTAIATVQTDVDNNEADADAAIALKEDTANKSADIALGTSDDAFPTQNAVKTYVDDLPRVYVGTFRITAAGTSTITGIPFTPSSITFTAYANVEDFNMDTDNGVGNNNNGLANAYGNMRGFARNDGGTITEQVIYIGGNGNSINDISRYASSSHAIGLRYSNQNGDKLGITSATVTSFNANGFTINTDSYADGIVVIFEAYR